MQVLIADDHDLVLSGLLLVLRKLDPEVKVLEGRTFDQAFAAAEESKDLDLAVLDLNMPGTNGLSGIEAFRSRFPDLKTIVMSGYFQPSDVWGALELGVAGFLPKTLGSEGMLNAFRLVLAGERFLPADLLGDRPTTEPASGDVKKRDKLRQILSGRELEVLQGVVNGMTNKEVGRTLDIQEVTVKLHLRSVYRKLGARNRAQAVKIALDTGLLK